MRVPHEYYIRLRHICQAGKSVRGGLGSQALLSSGRAVMNHEDPFVWYFQSQPWGECQNLIYAFQWDILHWIFQLISWFEKFRWPIDFGCSQIIVSMNAYSIILLEQPETGIGVSSARDVSQAENAADSSAYGIIQCFDKWIVTAVNVWNDHQFLTLHFF